MASFLFKTLTNPIRAVSAAPAGSRVFNANLIALSGVRYLQCAAGALKRKFNISEVRNLPDHRRRLLYKKNEERRMLYKAFLRDPDVPNEMREQFRENLSLMSRNSSITRIRNRCILTGRPRSVYRRFRISRICLRDLANRGMLPGMKKASW